MNDWILVILHDIVVEYELSLLILFLLTQAIHQTSKTSSIKLITR